MTNVLRQLRNERNEQNRVAKREAEGTYLILRIEQYASDSSYPYLSQQQQILSDVVEMIMEDFPFQRGEKIVFHKRQNCGREYVGILINGEFPSKSQMDYIQSAQGGSWDASIAAYEIIDGKTHIERRGDPTYWPYRYYHFDHDESKEISLG